MTRHELPGLPTSSTWREKYMAVLDKRGQAEETIHRNMLEKLRDEWSGYSHATVDMSYGGWASQPPAPWTVLDYASLAAQDTRKAQLFGPHASSKQRMYQHLAFEVNELAEQADQKVRQGVQLLPGTLEYAAYHFRNQAAMFFREYVVASETLAMENLAAYYSKPEHRVTRNRSLTKHAVEHGVGHVASHVILKTLAAANVISHATAVDPFVGFAFSYAVKKIGHATHHKITESPLEGVVFDQGKFAEITVTSQPVVDWFQHFIPAYRKERGKLEYPEGFDAAGQPTKIAKTKLRYEPADLLLLAESIYLYQSKWNFARGPFGHWSAAYLSLQRNNWLRNPQEILQGVN